MKIFAIIVLLVAVVALYYNFRSTTDPQNEKPGKDLTPQEILGNPAYRAISYGGYRKSSRKQQPTVTELKEDMKIIHAMGIRMLRTYNVHFAHASNLLRAIRQLKDADESFEMYVMLGAWIECAGARTENPDHDDESAVANQKEIDIAVNLAKEYPDIVKVIAVGNEAMVKWATSYFVQPWVILKYVNQLQELKAQGELPEDLWITSSDNFASWGGGEGNYHVPDLEKLIKAVDFISLHTYPMHDTHYNPDFWGTDSSELELSKMEKIENAMLRAREYAIDQYTATKKYIHSIAADKPIHIGETGWASFSNGQYGPDGSKATDEYKEALYHELIREWTDENNIACFYFEAFDENWKDANNLGGSENHFGLITIDGKAKYALWKDVDEGKFKNLTRGGNHITKTHGGSMNALLSGVDLPPLKLESAHHESEKK